VTSDSDSSTDRVETLQFEPTSQYAAMVDAFAGSVAAGKLLEPSEDGLNQMMVLDELLADARTVKT
jgi:hypothetical protein